MKNKATLHNSAFQQKQSHLNVQSSYRSSSIQDVIFDLDGTLIDSRSVIDQINRIVFSDILNRDVSLTEAQQKFSPEFSKLLNAYEISCQQKQARAISIWGKVSERFSYSLFDGVFEFLQRLSQKNRRLHLWTARDETSARAILQSLKIEFLFTTLSFANEVDSKPHKNSLKLDLKSIEPNATVVIGDSPTDIKGAHNIGAIAAAALWDSHAKKQDLISSKAELFFYTIDAFEHWLEPKV